MAMIPCKGCGEQISPKAAACPKCGHPNAQASHLSGGSVFLTLVVVGLGIWWMAGGGVEKQAQKELGKIEHQVAGDMVKQYEIAKRNGDLMQICVQAGMTTAAYLQANDEPNYQTWNKIQKVDCKKAGMPQ